MRLNRVKLDREEEEEDEKEDYDTKEEKEEEDEEEDDEEKGQRKEKKEEEGEEEDEEVEDDQEENEYDDDHHGKMMGRATSQKEKSKRTIKMPNIKIIKDLKQNKSLLKKIIYIVLVIIVFLIVLNVILAIVRKIKKKNKKVEGENDESKLLNGLDAERFNKLKEYLSMQYNSNGEININKFHVESINQKEYTTPDAGLTSIHISTALSDSCIQDVIIHLSAAIQHMSPSTFLHIHLMNTGNFTLETFSKLMNMVQKINNNTEIIVYNAQQSKTDFKMREDKFALFSHEYARLYALKAVKNIQKLIMLNINNVMVERDLKQLYNIEVNEIYLRGLPEVPHIRYKVEWMDNYLYDKSHFVNGDVLLVNLELCQREDFYNKAMELNNNEFYNKVEDPVQDIINVLMRKKIEFFEPKFNKINFYENPDDKNDESKWYPWVSEAFKYGEKNNHFYSKEDLLAADGDPFIINYVWEAQLGKKPKKYEEEKETFAKLNGFIN